MKRIKEGLGFQPSICLVRMMGHKPKEEITRGNQESTYLGCCRLVGWGTPPINHAVQLSPVGRHGGQLGKQIPCPAS